VTKFTTGDGLSVVTKSADNCIVEHRVYNYKLSCSGAEFINQVCVLCRHGDGSYTLVSPAYGIAIEAVAVSYRDSDMMILETRVDGCYVVYFIKAARLEKGLYIEAMTEGVAVRLAPNGLLQLINARKASRLFDKICVVDGLFHCTVGAKEELVDYSLSNYIHLDYYPDE